MRTEVTVSLGVTLNLGDFNSCRVDIGVKDYTRNSESTDEAAERVYGFVEKKLMKKVKEIEAEVKKEL